MIIFHKDISRKTTTLPMMQLAFGSISTAAPEQETAGVNLYMPRFHTTQQKYILQELNWNTGLVHHFYF